MAQLALGIAGAVIGSAIGGPIGASIGWTVGAALGGLLFPEQQQGPRLSDLRLQKSSYGGMLPIVYGTIRTVGNVIDQTDLTEHEQTSGGKGGPEVTTYTYTASWAIALCEGPIASVTRVWANGRLVYDVNNGSVEPPEDNESFPFKLYLGTEDQLPDPTLETMHAVGEVPAYLGTAYVVFTDFELTDFGNAIPNLEFEVVTKAITGCGLRQHDAENGTTPHWGSSDAVAFPAITGLRSGKFRVTTITHDGGPLDLGSTEPSVATAATYLYDSTTLEGEGMDLSNGLPAQSADAFPGEVDLIGTDPNAPGFSADNRYMPLMIYVYADGSTKALWRTENVTGWPVSATTQNVVVGGPALTALPNPSLGSGYDGTKSYDPTGDFLYVAGVPAGEFVMAMLGSANNRALYCFTGTPAGASSTVEHWYKIVDGIVVDDGAVDPVQGSSITSVMGTFGATDTGAGGTVGSFEVAGEYAYIYNTVTNAVRVYRIDPVTKAFTYDSACGVVNPTGKAASTNQGSILAYRLGFAALVSSDSFFIISRFPEGASTSVTLGEIVGDISERAGLAEADFDVSELTEIVDGYIIANHGTARAGIEPLQNGYFFDGAEIDDVIAFKHRGGPSIATITDAELAAHEYGQDAPPLLAIVRQQEVELPKRIEYNYINNEADYQTGTQTAERQATTSEQVVSINVPIAMTSDKAKAAASTMLAELWLRREKMVAFVSRRYAKLTPMDVITARNRTLAIRSTNETPSGVIKLDLETSLRHVYAGGGKSSPASNMTSVTGGGGGTIAGRPLTDLLLLDIPLVEDDDDAEGIYAAMTPATADGAWAGATLHKSVDSGSNYSQVAGVTTPATVGTATDVLGNFYGGNIVDELSTVTIVLSSGELSGTTLDGLLNGDNLALIGYEVVGFRDAVLTAANSYVLTGLLRGRRGTEWAMEAHEAGEDFVLLSTVADVDLSISEVGLARHYKAVTSGRTLASATAEEFTNSGNRLKPYAPVHLGGGSVDSGDVILNWMRRTRVGGAWRDLVDVPLSETVEAYIVEIWDASYTYCARIIDASSSSASYFPSGWAASTPMVLDAQSVTYTSAQQITDFGAQQRTIYFTVAQIGAVGIGTRARGTATGRGGSDSAVLVPIAPYASGPLNPPPSGTVNATLVWSPTAPHYTSGFTVGQTYVAQFTAGATTTATVTVAEYTDPPRFRHLRICTDAAGTNLVPGGESFGNTASATINVTNGVTYYAVIRCELPGGEPSGSLGADADMIIELSHP